MTSQSESNGGGFGDGLYRKRYLVTIVVDHATDDGDDWGATIGDALGSSHCLWDLKLVESVSLTAAEISS